MLIIPQKSIDGAREGTAKMSALRTSISSYNPFILKLDGMFTKEDVM